MSNITLEERVTKLEKLVDALMHKAQTPEQKKDWRRTVGMFKDDPIMKEIIEEGHRIRKEDRRQASA